ncbi:MAG TPA: nitrilase-related carbon-nitrogen hydrolase, partial [Terriglobia bacterium]|nr:nitrilase-related carbon-nitrogen hydrolase [Terriglobia bacterium]
MRDIRVAAVQFEHAPGDKKANLGKIRRFVEAASAQNVEIIVFPECCIVGYWFLRNLSHQQLHDLAEPVPQGPSSQALLPLAREFGMTIGAGLLEVDSQGKLHNTYVVAMPNGEWRLHRKIHAFEHDEIIPGSEFTVFDDPHGCRVGVLICYDVNINENVRIVALEGTEI